MAYHIEVAEILGLSIKTIDAQMVIAVSRIRGKLMNVIETSPNKIYLKK